MTSSESQESPEPGGHDAPPPAEQVAERLWRAYVPFRRGRGTSGDLASMLTILLLGRFAAEQAASGAAFLAPWRRAVNERGDGPQAVRDFGAALRGAAEHPGFPLRDLRVLGTGLFNGGDAYQDGPWVTAFLSATVQEPTPYDVGLPEVCDRLIERQQEDGGPSSGEFHPPRAVSRLLAELADPGPGERVLDPACGLGGPLAAVADRIAPRGGLAAATFEAHVSDGGNLPLATLNLALHGVDLPTVTVAGTAPGGSHHAGGTVDRLVCNPPFNQRVPHWMAPHWPFGAPAAANANFAWLQYAWQRLGADGMAAVIMAPRATWSEGSDAAIRTRMVEAGVVLGVVALPADLFAQTATPVHIWLLARDAERHRDGRAPGDVLFVDAGAAGIQVRRRQRTLRGDDVERIAQLFREWRTGASAFRPEPGFSAVVARERLLAAGAVLDPRLHVGSPASDASAHGAEPAGQAPGSLLLSGEKLARSAAEAERQLSHCRRRGQEGPAGTRTTLAAAVTGEGTHADRAEGSASAPGLLLAGPSGSLVPASRYVDAGVGTVPVVMPKNLADGGFDDEHVKHLPGPYATDRLARFLLRAGDVVIARRGELGRCSVVRDAQDGWVCGTGCFLLRPPEGLDPEYVAAYLSSTVSRQWLEARSTGGMTMKTVSLKVLEELPITVPDLPSQRQVAGAMRALGEHEELLRGELALARKLREDVLTSALLAR